jgi:DNA-directed RNA polymerase specialized sigma24 family protein
MAMHATDNQLLRAYARARDERAFAELVGRHADWITRAARRRLGDGHAADDAAQAVFLLLSRDAARLASSRDRKSLSAWLFHAMHFSCARIARSRARRKRHECSVDHLASSRLAIRGGDSMV